MTTSNKIAAGLHRRVKTALQQSGLDPGKSLVVAVSGGPDSLAMIHALCHLQSDLDLRVHGAHLDHGLRGGASGADALFVSETFQCLGIPFTLDKADVTGYRQKHGLSLEEAAREVRYAFLARVAAEQRANAIALGHTADDQAETVLMNIVRGSGLTGLRGMKTVARLTFGDRDAVLVRPLLRVSRGETVDYCNALDLRPRQDESNLSMDLKRNRVRMELLPLLEQYNPAIRDALARLSRSAARDLAYMEAETDKVWRQVVTQDEGVVVLHRGAFSQLTAAIQSYLLRRAVLLAKGDLQDVEQNHIDGMAHIMIGPAGRSLDLPGGIQFSVGYSQATLASSEHDPCPLPPLEGEHPLNLKVPGETLLPGWRVTARFTGQRGHDSGVTHHSQPTSLVACLDYDSVGDQLRVRSRRPGDRFQPLGMSQTKKLQDFMVDSKIPRQWRDRVPLVLSPKGIVWVVDWRIAEWVRVRDNEGWWLELRFTQRGG